MSESSVKYSSILANFKRVRANGTCGSKFNPQKYERGKRARKKNVTWETSDVSVIYEYEILTQFHRRKPNEIKKKRRADAFSSLPTTLCEMNRESVRCGKSANERERNCSVSGTNNKMLPANRI